VSDGPGSRRPRASLYRNWTTYIGAVLVVTGAVLVVTGTAFTYSIRRPGPYAGIITYVLFPAISLVGVVLSLVGMWRESLRRRRLGTNEALPFPAVDLNDPRQRRRFAIFMSASLVLFVVISFGGYNAFLLTESVGFCGNTCHTQMGPETTAYGHSPHARVPCVECHVGGGAQAYAASKANGVKQLLGVIFHTYDRPIPTPIRGLRPARETCEECHRPEEAWGSKLYQRPHFRYDEKATPEQISMLVKIGGGERGYGEGIHWHMNLSSEVTFVSDDDQQQSIPWVSVRQPDGTTIEYFRKWKPIDPRAVSTMPHHRMDCIDCHNRPAHNFEAPDVAVDRAVSAGVAPHLPWVKSVSVDALSGEYATQDSAHTEIARSVRSFYASRYPDVAPAEVEKLVGALDGIYDSNVFPAMKVSWKTYPSNIGHRNSPGCFRCHDGQHVSPQGRVLVSDCGVCHTKPQRGPLSPQGETLPPIADDWHPWQVPQKHLSVEQHKNILCHECHVTGRRPKTECNDCHGH
jgi:hypothetical protein